MHNEPMSNHLVFYIDLLGPKAVMRDSKARLESYINLLRDLTSLEGDFTVTENAEKPERKRYHLRSALFRITLCLAIRPKNLSDD